MQCKGVKVDSQYSDYDLLINDVFRANENGSKLLAHWNEELLHSIDNDLDPQRLAFSAGHKNFIVQINATIARMSK